MATLQQVEQALVNAHKAGDTARAKILADEVRRMRAQPSPAVDASRAANASPGAENVKQIGGGIMEGIGAMMPNPITPLKGLWASLTGDTAGEQAALEQEKKEFSGGGVLTPLVPEAKEGYEFPRKVGNFIGGSISSPGGAPVKIATKGAWDLTKNLGLTAAREAALGVTGAAGSDAGIAIAEEIAPDSKVAQVLSSIVGAGLGTSAPSIIGAGGRSVAKATLGDKGVPEGVDPSQWVTGRDVMTAAEDLGIPEVVTGGMVGNRGAATLDNTTAMLPVLGSRTARKMEELPGKAGAKIEDITQKLRTSQVYNPQTQTWDTVITPPAPNQLPENIASLADESKQAIDARVSELQQGLQDRVGSTTPVDVSNTRTQTSRMRTGSVADDIAPAPVEIGNVLRRLEDNLDATRNTPINMMADAWRRRQADVSEVAPFRAHEAPYWQRKVDENLGVPYETAKQERTLTREAFGPDLRSTSGQYVKGRQDALTADMRRTAEAKGVSPSEWDAIQKYTAEMKSADPDNPGLLPRLKKLRGAEERTSYKNLTGDNINRSERLATLDEGAMEAANALTARGDTAGKEAILTKRNQVKADLIENLGRKSAGQTELGPNWSIETFLTNWSKITDAKTRNNLTSGDKQLLKDLDNLATLARGARSRGRAINASNTQTHAALQNMLGKLGRFAPAVATAAAVGGGAWLSPLYGVLGTAAAKGGDVLLSSKKWPEMLLDGAKGRGTRIAQRATRGGAIAASQALTGREGGAR